MLQLCHCVYAYPYEMVFISRLLLSRPNMFCLTFERRPWTPQICKHSLGQTPTKKLWTELIFARRNPICLMWSHKNKTRVFTKFKNLTLNFLLPVFGEKKEILRYRRHIFHAELNNLFSRTAWSNWLAIHKNCVKIFTGAFSSVGRAEDS